MFALCIESSHARGMGHFFRGLNLAEELAKSNIPCKFYLNNHPSSLEILRRLSLQHQVVNLKDFHSNWEASLIQQDRITLWINDRLDTDACHAKNIKLAGVPLVTFDDRGSGAAFADLHIAALSFDRKEPLRGKKVLRGIKYLVLNKKIENRKKVRDRINKIIVTLGGSDTYNATTRVVKILKKMNRPATIVIGPAFKYFSELEKETTQLFVIKKTVPCIIDEFFNHDLAITGGGITPFEANASGLPCIIIANEKFEIPIGQAIENLGSALYAGYYKEIQYPLFQDGLPIKRMSLAGMKNIDLHGSNRIVSCLLEKCR